MRRLSRIPFVPTLSIPLRKTTRERTGGLGCPPVHPFIPKIPGTNGERTVTIGNELSGLSDDCPFSRPHPPRIVGSTELTEDVGVDPAQKSTRTPAQGTRRGRGGGVSDLKVEVPALLAERSLLAGEPVDLVQWQGPGGRLLYLIAPVDRAQLKAAFWSNVRASPSQGAWDTPERAVAGFAAGAKGRGFIASRGLS